MAKIILICGIATITIRINQIYFKRLLVPRTNSLFMS